MANFNKNFNVYDMINDDWDEPAYRRMKTKKQKQNVQNRKRAK